MKKYETLEHKADLKIRAFGRSKEELFLNMFLGMQDGLKPELGKTTEEIKREIKVKSLDLSSLLVDFLNECLYLIQTNKEIYNKVEFPKFEDSEIVAKLSGQKAERFGEDIKAATHHNLAIREGRNKIWEATMLFDI
jgi:SHS2 domain-containing protein